MACFIQFAMRVMSPVTKADDGWTDSRELELRNVLLLTDTVEQLVVAVGHDHMHSDEVVDGPEATGRDVTLLSREAQVSPPWIKTSMKQHT